MLFFLGLFEALLQLLVAKVPDSLEEPSPNPPTPAAAGLQDLILRPLSAVAREDNHSDVIRHFLRVFCCKKLPPQVRCFLLPAMSYHADLQLLRLFPTAATSGPDLHNSLWLLYSLLVLLDKVLRKSSLSLR